MRSIPRVHPEFSFRNARRAVPTVCCRLCSRPDQSRGSPGLENELMKPDAKKLFSLIAAGAVALAFAGAPAALAQSQAKPESKPAAQPAKPAAQPAKEQEKAKDKEAKKTEAAKVGDKA